MSFELQTKRFTFAPKLVPTLLAFIGIPILTSLGIWQLDRAQEKRVIDRNINEAIAKPALTLNDADLTNIKTYIYRSTKVSGFYDNKQFLLDNRTHEGKPGYHVISPFVFKQGSTKYAVLINRGWIHYENSRDEVPDISVNKEINMVLGSIKTVPKSIVLNDEVDKMSQKFIFKTNKKQLENVSLIQAIQLDKLNQTLNYSLLPVMIELDKTAEKGFVREWLPYYGSVDKHNAYAAQWFAMASIVLFLFFKLNIRKS